ncbi:hypothetical protein PEBR_27417 [Penicillium brasilianum]|uniref:Uncharacterized protein n=1 Tax=Penicillium brasilianum TaxID=104259 RepID=A0A1S9RUW1_PENBI|nr:hypothetical protein PEBR_27417 [Penicillium brasilianum]
MGSKKMAAIATILNPLATGEELTTYWNSNSGDLVMVHRKTPENPEPLKLEDVETSEIGTIKNPSSIAAVHYNGSIRVYAITNDPDANKETNAAPKAILKQVSPTVESLTPSIAVTASASLAGIASSNHDKAWLYFLNTDTTKRTQIQECTLGNHSKPKKFELETLPNTYLAAVYQSFEQTTRRLVFFQTPSSDTDVNPIHVVDFGSDALSTSTLDITRSAKPRTPLAACIAKASNGTEYIYIYFVDKGNQLNMALVAQNGQVVDSLQVHKAPVVADWSQLSVTAGAKHNFVTYVTKRDGDDVLEIYADVRK